MSSHLWPGFFFLFLIAAHQGFLSVLNDAEALLRAGMNVFLSVYSHFPPAMFYFKACSLIHLLLRVIPVEINPDTRTHFSEGCLSYYGLH